MIMSFLGGIMKSLVNPTNLLQLAMGPAGWASIATRTLMTAVAQEVIQKVGEKLQLPSSVINMAQQAFSATSGTGALGQLDVDQAVSSLAKQFGLNPAQEGQLAREADDVVSKLVDSMIKKVRQGGKEEASEAEGGSRGGESRLVALAKALGALIDNKMGDIIDKSKALDADKANGGKQQATISAEIQALSQEISFISNALNNSIKSIGEALSTLSRKS
jgi:hypothetical protein